MKIRTDLALEAKEMIYETKAKYMQEEDSLPNGMIVETTEKKHLTITKIQITTQEAATAIGRKIGKYITLEIKNPPLNTVDMHNETALTLAEHLRPFINELHIKEPSIMIVGLGNRNITPDSFGPRVTDKIVVTRHIKNSEHKANIDKRLGMVSAVSPGVMGTTGIETGEILKGLLEKASPDIIFVIDALCSRKTTRVNTTIQISSTGIVPGSGVGNRRMELSQETLGVPIIAIGVPTVVDCMTIVRDTISQVEGVELEEDVINSISDKGAGNMIVTPKDIDISIERMSMAISNGINLTVHAGFDLGDIREYLI